MSDATCFERQVEVSGDAIYRKIARRILPILFLCYIVAYLDRVNVGFAKLQMMGDLRFSDTVYGLGAGIFFLGYFLFEIPSNIILHRIGARIWICRVLISWGIVSGCTALVHTPGQFYAVRFLLGVAEAGFFPGMLVYFTYWFPSHRRARIMALLMAGNPISGIVGGPISGYILNRFPSGQRIAGWQWLFALEAMPAVILGVLVFYVLDDRAADVKWLTEREKAVVAEDIRHEEATKTHHTIGSVFTSWRVWLMCLIYFSIGMGSYAVGFWQPTIIAQTGVKSPLRVGLLIMLPYTVALLSMIFTGLHADKLRERRWHLVIPNLVAALGFLLCIRAGGSTPIAMTGLTFVVAGVITALPMFWALPTSFLGGVAAAAGLALINCMGNLSGFCSPMIIGFLKTSTGTLNSGLLLVAGCQVLSALLVIGLVPGKLVNR